MQGLLVTLALAAGSGGAAGQFNHDHLEAGYFQGEIADAGIDFDGFELRGGMAFGNWLVLAGYERIDMEPIDVAGLFHLVIGSESIRAGGGYAWPVHERIDIVSGAGLVTANVQTDVIEFATGNDVSIVPDQSDTGYFVVVGLRGRFTERLEGEFRHRFTNVLNDRANTWRVDVRYAFTPALAAGLSHRDLEGDTATGLGLRWNF